MKTYHFPLNFDYSSKFLGIFEYKILTPFCVFGFILAFVISKFNLSIIQSINTFILIYFPLFFVASTKIYGEPLFNFLICIIRHLISSGCVAGCGDFIKNIIPPIIFFFIYSAPPIKQKSF